MRSRLQAFYQQIGRLDLFEFTPDSALEYADVFPLIYAKMHLEGVWTQEKVKHVLVDEMQDLRAGAIYRIIPMVPVQKNDSQRWLPNCQSVRFFHARGHSLYFSRRPLKFCVSPK